MSRRPSPRRGFRFRRRLSGQGRVRAGKRGREQWRRLSSRPSAPAPLRAGWARRARCCGPALPPPVFITAENTPCANRRGPPASKGSPVAITACGGVSSRSACASMIRSTIRALASSGRLCLVALSDQGIEIGQPAQRFTRNRFSPAHDRAPCECRPAPRLRPVRASRPAGTRHQAGEAQRGARRVRGWWA